MDVSGVSIRTLIASEPEVVRLRYPDQLRRTTSYR